jgi:hypothetical protein
MKRGIKMLLEMINHSRISSGDNDIININQKKEQYQQMSCKGIKKSYIGFLERKTKAR